MDLANYECDNQISLFDKDFTLPVVSKTTEYMGSPQATWNCIYKSHRESKRLIRGLQETIERGYEKLYAVDIRDMEKQIQQLTMHLSIIKAGYEELENVRATQSATS